ncbi:hypothetical protein N7481_009624 [Penicillium waksmanii]|uniref:uncharacterized protein n=1 Tax=Penicillium waksmanii TaxID=69791 RepID=UPI0025469BCC|nr:uncharacterized protein N7481_009624 [Penicillium waksmanii]KAJ5975917.1 hypothetical protein N7481_009624 [Penicillium waksmanii]
MPSRVPPITYSSLPHLSTIINLQPDREPWCVGYAPSKGRRCHASTNANGRRCAIDILDEATEDLRAGDSINDLLKELAPYVLCRRFHQNQASDLARRWRKQVSSFVESRRSSPTQRTVQNTTGIRRQAPREQTSEEQIEVQLREIKQRIEELLWIEDFDGFPATSLRSQVVNDARRMMRTVGATNSSSTTTAIDNISQPRSDSITPVERPIRNLSDSTRSQSSRNSASSREILVTSSQPSSRRSEATTTMPPTSDSVPQAVNTERPPHSSVSATRKARVSRRPAEGECGICLCPLQEPQSYGTEDEEEEDEEDEEDEETDEEEDEGQDDNHDSEDEQGYYSDDDEPEVEVEEDGLVWCKAQCGVNYHRECIEKWLRSGHYDSCPTCRKTWRY